MTQKIKRKWHPNFVKYVKFISNHSNYKGLFFEQSNNEQIKWVVTGNSKAGKNRRKWWDKKCKEFGIKIEAGCYAKIARVIHPTKFHVCQICGKTLSIEYIYPNKRLLSRFNKLFKKNLSPYKLTIFEMIDKFIKNSSDIEKLLKILEIKLKKFKNISKLKIYIKKELTDKCNKKFLSPGVMSNSPDRYDGFHSDGNCCRSKSDKGRHKSNLQRYGQDRRVYENWSDGDWKKADRLMSEFRKNDISADHIGPISLGFCHRPKFNPLTKEENSSKNNRMNLSDVKILRKDEKKEEVISWHSKFIWDKLKHKIKTDEDAIKLSNLMRKNLHYILIIFSMIDENGYSSFLKQFLNPKYSFFDYKFVGFNPKTGDYEKIITKKLTGKNQKNNINRYYRIAFKKLEEYKNVNNRKTHIWKSKEVDKEMDNLFQLLEKNNTRKATKQLKNVLKIIAEIGYKQFMQK
ncbi:restriction endonuclease [Patescibacteria group bacterium]|nr:restriction endonuclease [Patescibacteria group bacterium]MCG2695133.1 restriction endonuclease [Candidatus Parcubacteria bacterium]